MTPAESTALDIKVDITSILISVVGSIVNIILVIRLVPIIVNKVIILLIRAKSIRLSRRSLKKL